MSDRLDPLEVTRIVDRFRDEHFRGEPDWDPLEAALPAAWWRGFMWMTRVTQGETVIELYKHGISRRYLNLDHEGGAWRYDSDENVYRPEPLPAVIEAVFQDIERCSRTLSCVVLTGPPSTTPPISLPATAGSGISVGK